VNKGRPGLTCWSLPSRKGDSHSSNDQLNKHKIILVTYSTKERCMTQCKSRMKELDLARDVRKVLLYKVTVVLRADDE
jgi:hypothetical protein